MACWILVPQPELNPRLMAMKALNSNLWTIREFPILFHYSLLQDINNIPCAIQ